MRFRQQTVLGLIVACLFTAEDLIAKHLDLLSSNSLENFELLDVALHGDYAFVPGGLGGLNIVNISDPKNIQVVGEYSASGCDWGRIYSWAVAGNYAYGTGRECGIHIIDISVVTNPGFVTSYSDIKRANIRYEHPSIQDSLLFASRHQHGVEILSLENPADPQSIAVLETDNAWSTLPNGEILYVADGSTGVKSVDIREPESPQVIGIVQTSGTAKDLALAGNFLFAAVGAAGVDMLDITDPANPKLISNYNTSGYASRVAVNDSLVAVSDWDDVEILRYTADELVLVGYKNTGGRVMALEMSGNTIYSAEWTKFNIFNYNSAPNGSDVDYSTRKLEFPRLEEGMSGLFNVTLTNNGRENLDILGALIQNPDFSFTFEKNQLFPGESQKLSIRYTPQGHSWNGTLHIETNDPDEPLTSIRLHGNYLYGPMVGDPAPDFDLPRVDTSGNMSLQDLAGRPVVLAFFTGW